MNHGKSLIASVKATASDSGAQLKLIVGTPPEAILRPVGCAIENQKKEDVAALTAWRNKYGSSFLTEFTADEERTSKWLNDVVLTEPGRILFMLEDLSGNAFGYMGLAFIDWDSETGEADAIVKGGHARKGLMTECLKQLLVWAQTQLGLRELSVRVRSDNPAVEFYRKFGFEERKKIPLRATEVEGEKRWIEDSGLSDPEVSLIHMKVKPI